MDAAVYKKLHPRAYLQRFLSGASVRSDGRAADSARRVSVTAGSVSSAVGSALAKLGRTTAVAGVTAALVAPPAAEPGVGALAVAVHVLPLAGPGKGGSGAGSGAGRSAEVACLAAFVRENVLGGVDLAGLCVEEGVLVWALKLTVYCVDHDGNLEDAMLLAATAALLDVRLPTVRMVDDLPEGDPDVRVYGEDGEDGEDGEEVGAAAAAAAAAVTDERVLAVVSEERAVRLGIGDFCLSVSFAVFEDRLLLDPSRDEEAVADARITLVLRSTGDLRAVHKPGGAPISPMVIGRSLQVAQKQVAALVKALELPGVPVE
jgi:exosome complex RNA-binding protein Rrp42 (RNase PH superfamily)